MDINYKSDDNVRVKINNGQRPIKTSTRPRRNDRMITKFLSNPSSRVKNKYQQDKNKEFKPRNPPPKPIIPPPSPKPLLNYSLLSYHRQSDNNNNNEKIKKRWCEYNETEPLPKLPINWI